jgi:hypothetical protein
MAETFSFHIIVLTIIINIIINNIKTYYSLTSPPHCLGSLAGIFFGGSAQNLFAMAVQNHGIPASGFHRAGAVVCSRS